MLAKQSNKVNRKTEVYHNKLHVIVKNLKKYEGIISKEIEALDREIIELKKAIQDMESTRLELKLLKESVRTSFKEFKE